MNRLPITLLWIAGALGIVGGHIAFAASEPPFSYMDMDQILLRLPSPVADAFRVVVLAQAGLALGFLGKLLYHFMRVDHDQKDQLLQPSAGICFVYFGMTVYVALDLASRIDFMSANGPLPYITWRTPFAFLLFGISDVSLYCLMKRFGKLLGHAQRDRSSVKLTVTSTTSGHPGHHVDLSTGSPVLPGGHSPE